MKKNITDNPDGILDRRILMISRYMAYMYMFFIIGQVDPAIIISDRPMPYIGALPDNSYHKYARNIYSQNGEDGILLQLLKELKIERGTFCEFGASDGVAGSNTLNLIKNYGFSGIAIEANFTRYRKCVINYQVFDNVQVFHGMVLYNDKKNNLNAWLKKGDLPVDLDILSIDIDGDDYYVWEGLTDFNPKIVIFETNSYRDPIYHELPGKPCKEYNIDLLAQWHPARIAKGCSFISAVELGLKKGYIPVAYTGNITFVRKDLVARLSEFPYIISDDPYDYVSLYTPLVLWRYNEWTTNTGLLLNAAIRDYFLTFSKQYVDIAWLSTRIKEMMQEYGY
ncbi:MAG: hypothetical protein M1114_05840 [Candidatus Dependentiae bacterium]|nr:hypothetical protein [Candidatus Dependentiae bacterium]